MFVPASVIHCFHSSSLDVLKLNITKYLKVNLFFFPSHSKYRSHRVLWLEEAFGHSCRPKTRLVV